ncbi:hypothetical protein RFI_21700 [Reticulomyxa filosa]|uniref:Uncharacterized protein n=1 Tax=Reticulomyxa filosa TaxID=46433 RepID=X6MQE8_RETFI|nr:hypothetical protein RFI_21700 [Reticulomyxa filosa]|eukprot:ETO15667.1 hypothetical protein RFI_21700 [Reticulomyxa filosa]
MDNNFENNTDEITFFSKSTNPELLAKNRANFLNGNFGVFKVNDMVRVIPPNSNLATIAKIIEITSDGDYIVEYYDKCMEEYVKSTFATFDVRLSSEALPGNRSAEENADVIDVLLFGMSKDDTNLKTLFQTLSECVSVHYITKTNSPSWLKWYQRWTLTKYNINSAHCIAQFLSLEIISFLVDLQYQWKFECLFCEREAVTSTMCKELCYKHILKDFDHAFISCDICSAQIHDMDYLFACSNKIHFVCLSCCAALIKQHNQIYTVLNECLDDFLYKDILLQIVYFTNGVIHRIKFLK